LKNLTLDDIDVETPIITEANKLVTKYQMKNFTTPRLDIVETKPINSTYNFSNYMQSVTSQLNYCLRDIIISMKNI